ncbi:MAG: SDR family oxidoreductase [Proteobacteria bacterium]|nr:SDR family oxidoreductase [Pseudomonadota bacterium]MBI3496710.1 SDR family oxidoreductase [Pseudomonadota bacterium]
MPTLLITGANRGLGLEFSRSYAADGWTVHAAVRDPAKATELKGLKGSVRIHQADVTNMQSVVDLAKALDRMPVDILINNAGVYLDRNGALGALDFGAWEETFRVNTVAPLRVAEALVDNVGRSGKKLMVFITSRLGSVTENGGGSYAYRASKAALNMAVSCLALDLKSKGIACLLLHPGWVKTDMGGASAAVAIPDSIKGMRKVIARAGLADTGKFYDFQGAPVAW